MFHVRFKEVQKYWNSCQWCFIKRFYLSYIRFCIVNTWLNNKNKTIPHIVFHSYTKYCFYHLVLSIMISFVCCRTGTVHTYIVIIKELHDSPKQNRIWCFNGHAYTKSKERGKNNKKNMEFHLVKSAFHSSMYRVSTLC